MQLYITLYFILLGSAVYFRSLALFVASLFIGIVSFTAYYFYKKNRKENLKRGIADETVKLNVNKADWWEFEELPEFNRVSAKKAVWIRNHNGKYSSNEDFCNKNNVKDFSLIEKYIEI